MKKSSSPRPEPAPFVCRRCGNCCTGDGYVSVSLAECQKIADTMGLALDVFLETCAMRQSAREYWLKDGEGEDQPCIFLRRDANGLASCRIEGDAKPRQCRDFPMKWRRSGFEQWCAGMRGEENSF